MIWEPYDLVSYFIHVIFGFVAFGAGILALISTKGSPVHVKAGKVFSYLMVAVALSTLIFMAYRFLPLAIVMAVAVLYFIPSAIFALRHKSANAQLVDRLLIAIPAVMFIFSCIQAVRFQFIEGGPKIGPAMMALTFGFILYQDIRVFNQRRHHGNFWIRRHLTRMVLAFTFAAMSVVRIGINFGLTFEQSTVFPLLVAWLVIIFYFKRYPSQGVEQNTATKPA